MEEKTAFLNMFSDYEPPDRLKKALSCAVIESADIDVSACRVHAVVNWDTYVSRRDLDVLCRDVCKVYGLLKLEITAKSPAVALTEIPTEELVQLFTQENPITRGSLAGAQWLWQDNTLTVHLPANGKKELEKCIPSVKAYFRQHFGTEIEILIDAGMALEGQALFNATEKMRTDLLSQIPAPAVKNTEAKTSAEVCFFGKPFRGTPVSMRDINLNMGMVTVEGRVFSVDHKELPKRNAVVIKFDITDNTGSVRINRFLENKDAKSILENVKLVQLYESSAN